VVGGVENRRSSTPFVRLRRWSRYRFQCCTPGRSFCNTAFEERVLVFSCRRFPVGIFDQDVLLLTRVVREVLTLYYTPAYSRIVETVECRVCNPVSYLLSRIIERTQLNSSISLTKCPWIMNTTDGQATKGKQVKWEFQSPHLQTTWRGEKVEVATLILNVDGYILRNSE
jgi:hypothetical protein